MNQIPSRASFWAMVGILFVQGMGCSTVFKESGTLERHAIIVNKAGKPYLPVKMSNCKLNDSDACDDSREWTTNEEKTYLSNLYDGYLDRLIVSAKEHFNRRPGAKKKLLLYIHGGLNQQENSNERASNLAKKIKKDTNDEYYPIFLNWNSALLSSYGEHLISVRQGNTDRWAWATSPTYLATDLGRGLIRAPVVWWSLVGNDLTSWPSKKDNGFFEFFNLAKAERDANKIALSLENESADITFPFWFGPQVPYTFWKDRVLDSTTTFLTYPIKFFSSPWIDALGKSAWENMLRRTDLLFHTENEFQLSPAQSKMSKVVSVSDENNHRTKVLPPKKFLKTFDERVMACKSLVEQKQGLVHVKSGGALSIFLRKLAEEILSDDYSKWSITLVGHSMGAIIVNHILRDFGTCLPIDNIVFMAAASNINSYKDSVFPFMDMRQREDREWRQRENRNTCQKESKECETSVPNIYHLMLHELAETSETNYWNLPPTGSLLVWIDNFLSTPNTPMDRTSGRFTNFMLSLHTTPEDMRSHISIKRFPGGGSSRGEVEDGIPKNHSDFSGRFQFWKEECWKPPMGTTPKEMFDNETNKHCFY